VLLDDELGMSSFARSNASATADADSEHHPSADSNPSARDVAHGTNAVPDAAGAEDCEAAAQSSRNRAHSCVLAMHRAKKGALHGPRAYVYDGVETTHVVLSKNCNVALTCAAPVKPTLYRMS
jgi:hypothetical protein